MSAANDHPDHPDLPAGLPQWIADTTGGALTRLERSVSRREGWLADVTRPDGTVAECFLRLARDDDPANTPHLLWREARVVGALGGTAVPVPAVLGRDETRDAVLYQRLPGRSDLQHEPPTVQDAVYRDYLRHLARLHSLDVDALDLGDVPRPASPEACSLGELDVIVSQYHVSGEPSATFGVRWLRDHVPHEVERIALVHGDAGTPNFLYDPDAGTVSGLIDWEWFHLGDPMEDLGNTIVHASFHPSGDWTTLLPAYEEAGGPKVDEAKVRYYVVHLLVRSVIALRAHCAAWDPHVPVALNLCYLLTNERMLCDAVADARGLPRQRPPLPDVAPPGATTLYDVVAENLAGDVLPALSPPADAFARSRLEAAVLLVQGLAREHHIGPALATVELDELGALLGRRPTDLDAGRVALDELVATAAPGREDEILAYLGRRAWRAEQLWAPVVSLFPDLELRAFA